MVRLEGVTKRFEDVIAVNNLSLEVERGEFLTLLGPSGCGKTTTLRMIAGFERPDAGQIIIDGQRVENLPPFQRDVNTVFQSYALFPHMTVFDNIAFGLRMKHLPEHEISQRVQEALRLVRLEGLGSRYPHQLSGGQQQRVALARAVVNKPRVLLLDEPLGALDLKLRRQMQLELKQIQQQLGITFIFVTHDQEEALTMSDRVAVMNAGVIEQLGTPAEIYSRPRTRFVADFVGETNLLDGKVSYLNGQHCTIEVNGLPVTAVKEGSLAVGEHVFLSLRPEFIELAPTKQGETLPNLFSGRVVDRLFVGSYAKTMVDLPNGIRLLAYEKVANGHPPAAPGSEVYLTWDPARVVVMKS